MKFPRLTTGNLMILVAVAAVVLASGRLGSALLGTTTLVHYAYRGPTTIIETFSPWPGRVVMALTAIAAGVIWLLASRRQYEEYPVTKTATIHVPSLKVTVPLAADALPRDLVPMDGPAGEPTLDIVLEGGSLTVRAKINGKNFRKLLKQVAEHGAENLAVALQGVLRPPASEGGPFVLEGAGFQAIIKAPRSSEPEATP